MNRLSARRRVPYSRAHERPLFLTEVGVFHLMECV